ncbi:MFS transporter [Angustibacter aerolatus]|uniref:MFS transporter n=1 Tax=Angustibacter aerolatus TaxID=1162965 RepID=A0ABQ6JDW1_9ACTN|nr:MFS transporter [Angustibacter aerolatus]
MPLTPYRRVLAVPGVRSLTLLGVLARVPHTAMSVVLTVHVVQGLHRGYAAAGLVVSVMTVGSALGSPWRGRMVDRLGLRRALLPSVVAEGAVWSASPFLPFEGLLVAVLVAGLLGLPVFTVTRLGLAALVPEVQRRAAFALDSMAVEVSFMAGPALGVVVATSVSTHVALLGIAVTSVLAGIALMVQDPPVRAPQEPAVAAPLEHAASAAPDRTAGPARPARPARPAKVPVTPRLLVVLAVTAASTVVLAGTDVSIVASLRESHQPGLTGLVTAVWALASLVGGLVYGAVPRGGTPLVLLLGLGALTAPVGLAPDGWWLVLTVVPAGLLCAPVMTATSEAITALVPERARGEAMGWHGSALTTGVALGAPLAGVAIDRTGAWAGFGVVGVAGVLLALLGLLVVRIRRGPAAATGAGVEAVDEAEQVGVGAVGAAAEAVERVAPGAPGPVTTNPVTRSPGP